MEGVNIAIEFRSIRKGLGNKLRGKGVGVQMGRNHRFLIGSPAIRNRRKLLKTKAGRISNRDWNRPFPLSLASPARGDA